jgi:CheY-like chemotaxis protein
MLSLKTIHQMREKLKSLTFRSEDAAELAEEAYEVASELNSEMQRGIESPLDILQDLAEEALGLSCIFRASAEEEGRTGPTPLGERLKSLALRLQGLHGDLETIMITCSSVASTTNTLYDLSATLRENARLASSVEETLHFSAAGPGNHYNLFRRENKESINWEMVEDADYLDLSLVEKCQLLSEGLFKIEDINGNQLSLPQSLRFLKSMTQNSSDSKFFNWCSDQALQDHLQIVLVDDDIGTRELLGVSIKNKIEAAKVFTCSNGEEALALLEGVTDQKFSNSQPTLILLDLMMPKLGGLEFLEKFSNQPSKQNAAVFVLTGSSKDNDISRSYELGALGYILKQELHRHISYVIRLVNSFRLAEENTTQERS